MFVFRIVKVVYQMLVIGFVMFLVQSGLAPLYGAGTAVALIAGPEALETWLVRQGHLPERPSEDEDRQARGDGGDRQRETDGGETVGPGARE